MSPIPSHFRKIGRRCAFPLSAIPLPPEKTLAIIERIPGLHILNDQHTTLVSEYLPTFAQRQIGVSKYLQNARPVDAPQWVNCSTFAAFVYAQMGVHLPRLAIQQSEIGALVPRDQLCIGDLVFATGYINRFRDNPDQSVGHVAIVIGPNQYIHANQSGVTLATESQLFNNREFRVARRYITQADHVVLLSCDTQLNIETADDIYWLLTKHL